MRMKKFNGLLEKFRISGYSDAGGRINLCLKILKILVKNHCLVIWLPREDKAGNYYGEFRSKWGGYFTINLDLAGNEDSDFIRYEFKIECGRYQGLTTGLGYVVHRIEASQSAEVGVMSSNTKLSLKYGYLILELYNKVANQLQTVVAQNKLRKPLTEALEALKIQMTLDQL